jgi:very-short-patch-repair endonuclease
MPTNRIPSETTSRAKSLRQNQTNSEGLLWGLLRARQLCGLKFRHQHPIGPFVADFACAAKRLVVEIDGGYHDQTAAKDMRREAYLRSQGWQVMRFTDEEVEQDAEAVGRAIASVLEMEYAFQQRDGSGSGMMSKKGPLPGPESPTLPEGG